MEKVEMIENLIADTLPIGKTVQYRAYAMELLKEYNSDPDIIDYALCSLVKKGGLKPKN